MSLSGAGRYADVLKSSLVLLAIGAGIASFARGAPVDLRMEIDRDANASRLQELLGDDPPELTVPTTPSPECPPDPEARAACLESQIARYTYQADSLRLRFQVFHWNHVSTVITFFMVMVIVAIGLFFAGVQFFSDRRRGKSSEKTDIKMSTEGLEVSSSVLGVIILTISLAFFYLYLVYVYPIQERGA